MVSTKFSLRIVPFLFVILSSNLVVLAKGKFMIVHPCRVELNDSLCYLVKKGQGKEVRETGKWELFCGEFSNLYFEEGFSPTLYVEKYDPKADTIRVIKTISRLNSEDQYYEKASCDCEKLRKEIKLGKTAEECDCSTYNPIRRAKNRK